MNEQTTSLEGQKQKPLPMTAEFIRAVAAKVYALWLHDLAIQQERQGRTAGRN